MNKNEPEYLVALLKYKHIGIGRLRYFCRKNSYGKDLLLLLEIQFIY